MSIKPVDFQLTLPKAAEVSRMQSGEQQKNYLFQQQQNSALKRDAANSLQQVHSQNKLQQAKIREKQEKRRNDEKNKKKSKNNIIYGKDTEPEDEIQISTIDIRL